MVSAPCPPPHINHVKSNLSDVLFRRTAPARRLHTCVVFARSRLRINRAVYAVTEDHGFDTARCEGVLPAVPTIHGALETAVVATPAPTQLPPEAAAPSLAGAQFTVTRGVAVHTAERARVLVLAGRRVAAVARRAHRAGL